MACNMGYRLQVIIKKSWYPSDLGHFTFIKIHPRIDIRNKLYLSQAIEFKKTGAKDITLSGSFNKTVYLPAESIDILYSIENPPQVLIKSIDLSLIQTTSDGVDGSSCRLLKVSLPNIINFQDKFINDRFSCTIPSDLLPASYQFPDDHRQKTNMMFSYMITFIFNIKGTACTRFVFDVPFILGTHSAMISQFSKDDQLPNY